MLELNNVSFSFGDIEVLKNLNLTIADHEFHSLVGLSASGKTLILKLISGLEKIQVGSIQHNHKKISFIFQNPELFPWLTIEKNLEICSRLGLKKIRESLKKFRLEYSMHLYPHQLSGGTLKKIAILRAFLAEADLILMDEPFTYLDLAQKEEIYSFIEELQTQYHPTIVLVTHDIDEAIFLSTHISYLSKKDKTIVENFSISTDKNLSFNESKTKNGHIQYFNQIYNRLRSELN